MNKKRVSIIIPVYNLEKYIGRCVGSLLKQTYTNYEILLIDNGSLDKSKSIIDKLAKENIDIVKAYHIKKNGVSNARNYGIVHSTGELLIFVDGDDYVIEDYIRILAEPFCDNNLELSVSDYFVEKDYCRKTNSSDDGKYRSVTRAEALDEVCGAEIGGYIWNKCFRRDVLMRNSIRFDINIRVMEDALFCVKYICCVENIMKINKASYIYSTRPDSTMGKSDAIRDPSQLIALKEMYLLSTKYSGKFRYKVRDRYSNLLIAIYYSGRMKRDVYTKNEIKKIVEEIEEVKGELSRKHKIMLLVMKRFPTISKIIVGIRKNA